MKVQQASWGAAMKDTRKKRRVIVLAIIFATFTAGPANGYTFNEIVPDVRQPVSVSGGSACPVHSHIRTAAASHAVQWSTALGADPLTIITQDQTAGGRLAEIEQVITQSVGVWSGVSGTVLQSLPAAITRTTTHYACGADGLNSICFDQADLAFTPGVLAFTRVITADRIGVQVGVGTPSAEVGEILDAHVYFNPSDSRTMYATPSALPGTPAAYDLESILTHELGHTLGFGHSAVWNAMMFSLRADSWNVQWRASFIGRAGCVAGGGRPHRAAHFISGQCRYCACWIDTRKNS
jgi:hypothetical protein